jgi:hypothetical protein
VIDLGLPDGSGLDLIAELAAAPVRVGVILGTWGDGTLGPAALAAGGLAYVSRFLAGLARSAGDRELEAAAEDVQAGRGIERIAGLVADRLRLRVVV